MYIYFKILRGGGITMKIKRRYRKVKKRYPKVLLTMTLVLSILLIPFNILASGASAGFALGAGEVAEVNGTGYSTLGEALSAWTAGSTLKLLSDVITTSPITVPTGEHTFDLNGYGILMTGNDRVITINQGASLVLNDSDPDRIHYITLTNYRGTAVSDSGEESVSNGNGVIKVTGACHFLR